MTYEEALKVVKTEKRPMVYQCKYADGTYYVGCSPNNNHHGRLYRAVRRGPGPMEVTLYFFDDPDRAKWAEYRVIHILTCRGFVLLNQVWPGMRKAGGKRGFWKRKRE